MSKIDLFEGLEEDPSFLRFRIKERFELLEISIPGEIDIDLTSFLIKKDLKTLSRLESV